MSQDSVGIRGPLRGGDRERPRERQARPQDDDDAGGSGLGSQQLQGQGTARRPRLLEGRERRPRRRVTTHVPRPAGRGHRARTQGRRAGRRRLGAPVAGNEPMRRRAVGLSVSQGNGVS